MSMKLRNRPALRWMFRSQSCGRTVKLTVDESSGPIRERNRALKIVQRKRMSKTIWECGGEVGREPPLW